MIDISIIIPVYNVEKHIERCVNSVATQHFNGKFEVILVDDGSTDNSYSILLTLQEKYGKEIIKIIQHDKNRKLSQARKTGFIKSRGKYIWNIDSDDWIENNALQELYDITRKKNVDVIIFNGKRHDGEKEGPVLYVSELKNNFYTKDLLQRFYCFFDGAIVTKFIRRNVIHENFEVFKISINSGEDRLYGMELFSLIDNLYFTDNVYYYYYYYNTSSITSTVKNNIELLNNFNIRIDSILNILNKTQNKISLEKFSSKFYSNFILLILLLKFNPHEFSKTSNFAIEEMVIKVNQMLQLTCSNYKLHTQDLKKFKILNKNIKYYGFWTLIKKIATNI